LPDVLGFAIGFTSCFVLVWTESVFEEGVDKFATTIAVGQTLIPKSVFPRNNAADNI
jgi:hypothetical protein